MRKQSKQAITMRPVESSAIAAIGHDADAKVLRIQFQSGHTYDYPDVTADEYDNFRNAKSAGAHFHQNLRGREGKRVDQ